MPEIPVLMPVAAGPMTELFCPLFELMKSPIAPISHCSRNKWRSLVIEVPGFEQPGGEDKVQCNATPTDGNNGGFKSAGSCCQNNGESVDFRRVRLGVQNL
ncbi:MAG: hypothetical protein ACI4V2_00065 [Alloprevotella sp.]